MALAKRIAALGTRMYYQSTGDRVDSVIEIRACTFSSPDPLVKGTKRNGGSGDENGACMVKDFSLKPNRSG